jgi:hypothetical protein
MIAHRIPKGIARPATSAFEESRGVTALSVPEGIAPPSTRAERKAAG